MPLIPLMPLLHATERYRFGQPAFNVNTIAQVKAIIEVHEMFRSPALIQGADLANGFMGGRTDFISSTIEDKRKGAKLLGDAVKKYAENSPIPIVLHLDHGKDLESVKAAIDGGYTSVMIDGSSLPYEENIELTQEVVKYAHARGVTVEGELGVLAGVEDHVFSNQSTYTNPLQALDFIKRTEVDSLAISYGTMHGPNKGKDVKLRREIVVAIKEILRHEGIFCAIVSHGSSTIPGHIVDEINGYGGIVEGAQGISIGELKKAISAGINKINVDTDIRLATTRNLRELFMKSPAMKNSDSVGAIYQLLEENRKQVDPRVFFQPIMDTVTSGKILDDDVAAIINSVELAVKEIAGSLIVNFGSAGKAPLVELLSLDDMVRI
ncbi:MULTISPECIES: class II fructose-bisphosphate aldolase [Mesobacillus]|uniref:Fructose-bisphosphate aldolase n=2 Tax=Mesobacillus TaxID=2675231 RepID=A0A0D6ZDH1_9BACI|nr:MULTISPECIES: class II fructose-bisphosphate aldolase [Mesobacillus]KIY23116.1 fructose-bisphosphate aldolase [Mesobacillus subterraneus]MDQ0415295.1 fructose-bisphosphate aldolase class II [Mesobacillus stamsii]